MREDDRRGLFFSDHPSFRTDVDSQIGPAVFFDHQGPDASPPGFFVSADCPDGRLDARVVGLLKKNKKFTIG